MNPELIDWLLAGDPAIRWQTMRDLLNVPREDVVSEQGEVGQTGWGAQLLAEQGDDGRWTSERGPSGYRGLYTPKWTSTTYTLLLLRRLGLAPGHTQALRGCDALVEGSQWLGDGSIAPWASPKTDTCVCGMILGILEWFEHPDKMRRDGLVQFLIDQQKDDA